MTYKPYPEVSANPDFAEIERKILQFWSKHDIFAQSISSPPSDSQSIPERSDFIFYDGPPFANGLPHYGHLLTGYIKDTYGRYQTQKGKKVERKFGWDCHGLPAEMQAEKELKLSGRSAIIEYGIDRFNDHCKKSVMKYSGEWEQYVTRQGRWVDFAQGYRTMDIDFMESVLWVFKQLYDKGYIYQSLRVMPYSWACETPLSNFETRLDNAYRERADKAVTVSFKLKSSLSVLSAQESFKEYRVIAWTTTPWTLPSNLALAVGPQMRYVAVAKDETCYIIARSALAAYKSEIGEAVVAELSGEQLVGLSYEPIFNYFQNHENAFKILSASFVEEGSGSGIVHIAPGFGEEDQALCQAHHIDIVCPVDNAGKFTEPVSDFVGRQVFEANDDIIISLKKSGNWLKTEQYLHNYPHCWRTDTPLIYKAVSSWYVKVTEFKDRMVQLNKQINWLPAHVGKSLFENWLENARDWSVSRNRFWGTPIPIWQSDDPKYPRIDVYGSIKELEADFGVQVSDLHRPMIDQLVRPNPDDPTGKSMMRRVPEVFDCWFESGAMPYGQAHYPFNAENFHDRFPADFITEYVAQTRGWFYTLMVLSTALFDKPPFLNCLCHGVVLDNAGQKLSKRLNNYPDPLEIFERFGADAMRFTMLASSVAKGQELLIDREGMMIFDTLRLVIKPLWNAYNFFTLYANADKINAKIITTSSNIIDEYILAKLRVAVLSIDEALSEYNSQVACNHFTAFFGVLTNWYIRRNRERFWKSEHDADKQAAYDTLYTCLMLICRSSASLLPLITEEVYLGLSNNDYDGQTSVHLTAFPRTEAENLPVAAQLVRDMDFLIEICNSALSIRNAKNVRIRQPLSKLTIVMAESLDFGQHTLHFLDLLKDELNVKEVVLSEDIDEYATPKLTLNFSIIAKRMPHKVKDIIAASKQNAWRSEQDKLHIADCVLNAEEFSLVLAAKDEGEARTLSNNLGVVFLDLHTTRELRLEGLARDLIRAVQQARKDANLHVTDHIDLHLETSGELQCASQDFGNMIQQQCLANYRQLTNYAYRTAVDLAGEHLVIAFSKR